MESSRELRNVVLGLFHEWSRGDPSVVDLVSPHQGTVVIGTDPEEWWTGGSQARAVWAKQLHELGPIPRIPLHVEAWVEGTVGWAAARTKVTWSEDTELIFRTTFLFHREHGDWKVVQVHQSLGVPNEETTGFSPTTSIEAVAELVELERPDLQPSVAPDGTLTIMFTDIEASTAMNEAVGDDRFVPVLTRHADMVQMRAESLGGTIVKSMGDGFMLAFPSARRAVECAASIQRDVSELDVPIRVRMGLHTGEPTRHADDFYGRDVSYAARLGTSAQGGEILVSSLVKALVEPSGSFTFEGPRELELKGFDGPQPVFEVLWR